MVESRMKSRFSDDLWGGSIVDKLTESTARQVGGTADGSLKYLTEEEYSRIHSDEKLKEVSEWIYVGEFVSEELLKLRTEVHWSDEVSARKSFCYPEVGRLPHDTKEDEIATSSLVLNAWAWMHRIAMRMRSFWGRK